MQKRIETLNNRIDSLVEKNENFKKVLNRIQIRDLSKNFLRTFYYYLDDRDFKKSEKIITQKER